MTALSKSPNAMRTIREVADELSLEPYVLRFWEKEFKQIKPTQGTNGRRYYRAEDVAVIRKVQALLHEQGYTIKGARAVLAGKVEQPIDTPKVDASDIDIKNALREELEELQKRLLHLREKVSTAL